MTVSRLPSIVPAGDAALLVVFGEEISLEVYARVRSLAAAFERDAPSGIQEVVVAYAALLIHYDPLAATFERVEGQVLERLEEAPVLDIEGGRLRVLPTVYGGGYGPDLPDVARYLKLEPEEVVRLFSTTTFLVYMLGFSPGNAYMGGLPPRLAMPRLERPREYVPTGTVSLAHQATVYPMASPGGWRWLGRTAVKLFDPAADPPNYLQAGDRVQFPPISEEEYLAMGGEKVEPGALPGV